MQRVIPKVVNMGNCYHSSVKLATEKLSSGHQMPLIGLGTWKLPKGEVQATVESALKAGYRHIDTAYIYGNEDEIGSALEAVFAEGALQRSEVFITSKLWNTHHAPAQVKESFLLSLTALKLSYLDLYLMHAPLTYNKGPVVEPPLEDTWAAMEKLVDEGLVRAIGVCNFSEASLRKLVEHARIPPVVLQVEMHPYLRQDALLEYCRSANIHVTAYSPMGSPDSADLPFVKRPKALPTLLKHPLVVQIAEKLGKDAGQVLLRWAVQRGTSAISKSASAQHMQSNLNVLDWELPAEDFQVLSSFQEQIRYLASPWVLNPEGPYRTLADLWGDPEEDARYAALMKKYGDSEGSEVAAST